MALIKPTTLAGLAGRQRSLTEMAAETCGRIATLVPYALIVLLPLTFWLGTNSIFDLPKVTVLRLLTLVALGAWLARAALVGRLAFWPTRLLRPVLVYATVLVLATAFSKAPVVSLFGIGERHDGLVTQLNFIVLFFITANVLVSSRQVRRALELHVLTAAVVAALGILQYFGVGTLGLDADYWSFRAYGTLGNPDFLGAYLVLALPSAIALTLVAKSSAQTATWSAVAFFILVGLMVTFTRGAWVGGVVALIVLAWLLRARLWAARRRIAGLLAAVILVALATQLHWPDSLRPSKMSGNAATSNPPTLVEVGSSAFQVRQGTAGNRLLIWQGTIALVKDNPVLGVGLNAMMGAFSRHAPVEYSVGEGMRNFPDKAHNELLQVAATTGLVGLAAYLWLLGATVLMVRRGMTSLRGAEERAMLAALAATGLGYLAQAMFVFPVIDTGALVWVVLALLAVPVGRKTAPWIHLALPVWCRGWLVLAVALLVVWLGTLAVKPLVADLAARQGDVLQQGLHRVQGEAAAVKATQALERYREAIAWYPYDEQYYRRLAITLRVQAAGTEDRIKRRELLDEAVRALTKAIMIDPNMAGLYLDRGVTYQSFGDDHRVDALNDYRRAVKLYPYYYAGNKALADLGRQMKRQDEGIVAQLNILAALPNDRETLLKLGEDYMAMGRVDEGIETWERLAKLADNDATPFLRLGVAYAAKKDVDAARGAFERALALNPKSEEAQRALKKLSEGDTR